MKLEDRHDEDGEYLGKVDCLPQDNSIRSNVLTKIGFFYLEMAEVESRDIESMSSNPIGEIAIEAKYRIAITVMQLRFFF